MPKKHYSTSASNKYQTKRLTWKPEISKQFHHTPVSRNDSLQPLHTIFRKRQHLLHLLDSQREIDLKFVLSIPIELIESIRDDIYRSGGYRTISHELRRSVRTSILRILQKIPSDTFSSLHLTSNHQHKIISLSLLSPIDVVRSICEWTIRQSNRHYRDEALKLLTSLRNALSYREKDHNQSEIMTWLTQAATNIQSPYESTNLFVIISSFLRVDRENINSRPFSFLFILQHILFPMLSQSRCTDLHGLLSLKKTEPQHAAAIWQCEKSQNLLKLLTDMTSYIFIEQRMKQNLSLVKTGSDLLKTLISLCSSSFQIMMEETLDVSKHWYLCYSLIPHSIPTETRTIAFQSFFDERFSKLSPQSDSVEIVEICEHVVVAAACAGLQPNNQWFEKVRNYLERHQGGEHTGQFSYPGSVWVIAMTRHIPLMTENEISCLLKMELPLTEKTMFKSNAKVQDLGESVNGCGTSYFHITLRALLLISATQKNRQPDSTDDSITRFATTICSFLKCNTQEWKSEDKSYRFSLLEELLHTLNAYKSEDLPEAVLNIFRVMLVQLVNDHKNESMSVTKKPSTLQIRDLLSRYSMGESLSAGLSLSVLSVTK